MRSVPKSALEQFGYQSEAGYNTATNKQMGTTGLLSAGACLLPAQPGLAMVRLILN